MIDANKFCVISVSEILSWTIRYKKENIFVTNVLTSHDSLHAYQRAILFACEIGLMLSDVQKLPTLLVRFNTVGSIELVDISSYQFLSIQWSQDGPKSPRRGDLNVKYRRVFKDGYSSSSPRRAIDRTSSMEYQELGIQAGSWCYCWILRSLYGSTSYYNHWQVRAPLFQESN